MSDVVFICINDAMVSLCLFYGGDEALDSKSCKRHGPRHDFLRLRSLDIWSRLEHLGHTI